jgi:hypothetical protein
MADATVPFRWDLITPDQFGTLIDGTEPPTLWFVDDLIDCAGKVLARSGDGDLYFVGRSLDSMFDLLGGALDETTWRDRLHRLPLSFARPGRWIGRRVRPGRLNDHQVQRARRVLTGLDLQPYALARRKRPATFVDIVHNGSTFTELFSLLRRWVDDQRETWPVIRRKLRFVGVTVRKRTSPNTFRWQQHAEWTSTLPSRSVVNVSLDGWVWGYLGNDQYKLTRTFRPNDWLGDVDGPVRGEHAARALAQALALVEHGRSREARAGLVRTMAREPAIGHPWLRALVVQLDPHARRPARNGRVAA